MPMFANHFSGCKLSNKPIKRHILGEKILQNVLNDHDSNQITYILWLYKRIMWYLKKVCMNIRGFHSNISYRFECCSWHHKYLNIWRSLFSDPFCNKMSQKVAKINQNFCIEFEVRGHCFEISVLTKNSVPDA